MGLVFGWLRSVPHLRRPEPALWVFDTSDSAVFIAVVGLEAGRFRGRPASGSVPLSGRRRDGSHAAARRACSGFVLKMNPVLLLGACAGPARPPIAARDPGRSPKQSSVLTYTVPYAMGAILLTACGPLIVLLTQ
jgi:putative transport protein